VPLDEYRRKRDARRTPEPVPEHDPDPASLHSDQFVIQEHHARRLHWDVRLERDGALASWAVPKGLPAEPGTIRLAVRTEDHPMEYLEFHGEIPAGEYGAGTMTIWDRGRYETVKWSDNEVHVVLHGDRVEGRYVFLRKGDGPKDWLVRRSDPPSRPDWVPLPHDAIPMITTPGELPQDEGWYFQVAFGGTPVIVRVEGGRIQITDADGDDITGRHPRLAGLGPQLGGTQVLLDAEIAPPASGQPAGLWLRDVLHLDGTDLTPQPYDQRRERLAELPLDGPHWRRLPSYPGGGAAVLQAAAQQELPAVLAKKSDVAYLPGTAHPGYLEISTGRSPKPAEPAEPAEPSAAPRRSSKDATIVETAGRRLKLSNPDKVLYPATGFRKIDVLEHYLAVAPVMLPHLKDRPVTMVRWPDGVTGQSFFEKNVSRHAPDWLRTVRVETPGSGRGSDSADFPLIDDEAGLAWVSNLAALELHVPQWRVGGRGARKPPDLMVYDLDPGEGMSIVDCCRVAERIAELLAEDGLVAYPRTSGGKGLQLYLPVKVTRPERTSEYAAGIAERLAKAWPQRVVATMAKARRVGKVFIDWSQNNPAKTTIASYALRGRTTPTVATPVTWDEVQATRRPADLTFTAPDLPARIAEHGDLLAPLLRQPQRLPR
jgi:bifunctional non-homologous end joining protein LigD